MKNQSNRIWTFELIRPILLFMVINSHTLLAFYRFDNQSFYYLNYIAVPLFIMISVFLFQRKIISSNNTANLAKRINRLILPYYFWSIVSILLIPGSLTLHNLLWSIFLIPLTNGPLYFLTLMIIFTLIQFMIRLIKIQYSFWIFLIFISFSIELFHIDTYLSHLNEFIFKLTIMFGFALLKYFGITIILFNLYRIIEKYAQRLFVTILLVLIPLLLFVQAPIKFDGFDYNGYVLFIWATGIFILLLTGKNISLSDNIKKKLNILNRYGLGIFCIHQIIITLTFSFLKQFLVLNAYIFELVRLLYVLWIYALSYILCNFIDNLSGNRLKLVVS